MASTAGATLLALGAVALTPTVALAINECGVGSNVTCTPAGNDYPNGITYIPVTDFTITVEDGVNIDTSGSLNIGLFVIQGGPTGSIDVNAGTGVTINTTDDGAFGVLLATNAGDITADLDAITTSGANASGVLASSADGAVDVTVNSVLTMGDNASGIEANTNNGAVTVNATTVNTRGAGAAGIIGASDTADVTITAASVSTTGAGSIGIQADSPLGVATVNSGSVSTTGAGSTGILVNTNRSGTAVVNSQTVVASGAGSQGITAYGGDGVTVGAGAVSANGTAITASSLPIIAFGPPPQPGNVSVTATGNVASTTAIGIDASSARGNIRVTTTAGRTLTAGTVGIRARSTGLGDGGADGVTDGHVTVISNAAIGTAGIAIGGDGIQASITNAGSAGRISVSTASIYTAGSGVVATNAGTGTTAVTTGGTVQAAADGINLTSVGAYTVNVNGSVRGGGNGIQTSGTNGGTITVAAGGLVQGLGTGPTTAVIDVTAPAAQTTTINNNGTVRSTNATVIGSAGDLAIRGTGGSVTVNNAGRLDGRMDFSGLGAGASATVNNSNATGWHTTGLTTFSAGNDLVNNTATGLLATSGSTTFDFGADTGVAPRDVLTNAGRIVVGETSGASTFTLTGLERFNNSGVILLGSLNGTTTDGQTNDRLVMTGTGGGTAFIGSGGSVIALDASLGAATQANCAAATVADCVSLPGGAVSGSTLLRVNNTNTGFGAMNAGIVLVDATGGTIAANAFSLDPTSTGYTLRSGEGAIDTGLFFYRLAPQGSAQIALVSAPDSEAFEFVGVGQIANNAWQTATGVWFDRQADLRDGLEGKGEGGAGIWMRIVGGQAERDLEQTYVGAGGSFVYDTGYEQNTVALIGGIDLVAGGGDNSAWVFGGSVGYVDTDVDFNASPTQAALEGGVFGLYGTYVSGGLFIDATLSALMLDMTYSMPTVMAGPGMYSTSDADVTAYGARIEGGWRMPLGESAFIEPLAGVAYVRTSIDDLDVPGGVVSFDESTSLRANVGVRLGTIARFDTMKVKFTVLGRAWNEFDGEGQTTLVNGGPDVLVTDQFDGAFGEVGAGIDVFGADERFSAFVNAGYRWNEDWTDTTVALGARYRW
ncbi:MAG: autotransporter outer membrane beta-barrel domain-containing protein [Caulobacter sp.]|nr:autotransporter outer membrane beta-barrel domain-containing protein [Caulobacter sp.]